MDTEGDRDSLPRRDLGDGGEPQGPASGASTVPHAHLPPTEGSSRHRLPGFPGSAYNRRGRSPGCSRWGHTGTVAGRDSPCREGKGPSGSWGADLWSDPPIHGLLPPTPPAPLQVVSSCLPGFASVFLSFAPRTCLSSDFTRSPSPGMGLPPSLHPVLWATSLLSPGGRLRGSLGRGNGL